ncbi:hypothetical protein [Desulfomicrobium escambiense]|uniref:hypothetical protein n=1 Tax=Desulfomicrobium escambiense TaxID=29503 RepID=UPI001FDFA27E|nr:hypothetical protein [Desulfomicrobium escambiense]
MVPLMTQEGVKLVVVHGKRGFAADAAAEGKLFGGLPLRLEPSGVHEDAVLPVLPTAHGH